MKNTMIVARPSLRALRVAASVGVAVAVAVGSLATFASAQGGPPNGPPNGPPMGMGPGGGRGGPGAPEVKLVKQFDRDGDKRLNVDERKAAREFLASNPQQGFGGRGPGGPGGRGGPGGPGGRGGFGGRGMPEGKPGAQLAPADVKSYGKESMYDTKIVRTFFLQFESTEWEQELAAFHNTDVEVPATITVDGKAYPNVGVHFRGASSFMMVPAGLKRSLNLSFDFADENQRLGGYTTFNLLNANGDATYLRTIVYQQIAQSYVPIPRVNYVRVVINGESWGLYVSQQQFNKDFTKEQFGSTGGARWKAPGSPQGRAGLEYLGNDIPAYERLYEIKSKDDPASWRALINMTRVLNETPADRLEAALSPLLDIDGALKFLALENVFVNEDGYWTRASDYAIYLDEKGKFHILPHDFNEAFPTEGGRGGGPGGRGGPPPGMFPPGGPPDSMRVGRGGPPDGAFPGGPPQMGRGGGPGRGGVTLDPLAIAENPARPLLSKLVAVPALRTKYLGYVRDIADRGLDWKTLEPRVTQFQALIAADVRADTRKLSANEGFDSAAADFKKFADERRAFILNHAEVKKATGR